MMATEQRTRREETVAFRVTRSGKRLIQAAAERYDAMPSEWLREVVEAGLQAEFGHAGEPGEEQDVGRL